MSFDVNAKLEEKDRKSGKRVIGFVLTVGTKPSVAKFEVEGIVTLEGKNPAIDKLLEVNPTNKIPLVLNRVYQSVFTSTYLLATSYPPPDMLSSGELNKQGAEGHVEWESKEETKTEENAKQTKKKVKPKGKR